MPIIASHLRNYINGKVLLAAKVLNCVSIQLENRSDMQKDSQIIYERPLLRVLSVHPGNGLLAFSNEAIKADTTYADEEDFW